MSHNPVRPEELADIIAELKALGEDPIGADELGDAAILSGALDALRDGPQAVEALDAPSPEARARLQAPLAGLHRLRASTPEGVLDPQRSEALFDGLAARLPAQAPRRAKVIPFPLRPAFQIFFAAAAAILLVAFLGFVGVFTVPNQGEPSSMAKGERPDLTRVVAQVELEMAESHLKEVEMSSLKTLMSARQAPEGPIDGDHYLRDLRQARSDAVRARRQARARRL